VRPPSRHAVKRGEDASDAERATSGIAGAALATVCPFLSGRHDRRPAGPRDQAAGSIALGTDDASDSRSSPKLKLPRSSSAKAQRVRASAAVFHANRCPNGTRSPRGRFACCRRTPTQERPRLPPRAPRREPALRAGGAGGIGNGDVDRHAPDGFAPAGRPPSCGSASRKAPTGRAREAPDGRSPLPGRESQDAGRPPDRGAPSAPNARDGRLEALTGKKLRGRPCDVRWPARTIAVKRQTRTVGRNSGRRPRR